MDGQPGPPLPLTAPGHPLAPGTLRLLASRMPRPSVSVDGGQFKRSLVLWALRVGAWTSASVVSVVAVVSAASVASVVSAMPVVALDFPGQGDRLRTSSSNTGRSADTCDRVCWRSWGFEWLASVPGLWRAFQRPPGRMEGEGTPSWAGRRPLPHQTETLRRSKTTNGPVR